MLKQFKKNEESVRKIKIILLVTLILPFFLLIPLTFAAAQTCADKYPNGDGVCAATCPGGKSEDTDTSLCTGQKCCHSLAAQANVKLQIPIFGYTEAQGGIAGYIGQVYSVALYIIVPISIVIIIFAGSEWIGAAGNQAQIQTAKSRIIRVFIGLSIALGSYLMLSLFGLTSLKNPEVTYIPQYIPTEEINNETGTSSSSYNFDNLIIPTAEAAVAPDLINEKPGEKKCAEVPINEKTFQECINNGRVTVGIPKDWNCPKCANVTELKQYCPRPICDYSYAGCGTVASSGCGIASLTMAINFLGGSATIQQVTDLAKAYRNCPGQKCTGNGCPSTCNPASCTGTKYDVFVSPQKTTASGKSQVKYGPSSVLANYGLKGDIITGGPPGDTKKAILDHLSKGEPIIISTSNQKVTAGGHFILLIGCTDCLDDEKRKVFYRDPNMVSSTPFTKQHNLFSSIKVAFWLHK